MSVNEVIELGKQIERPDYPWYSEFTFGSILIIIILIVLAVMLMVSASRDTFAIGRPFLAIVLFIIALLMIMGIPLLSSSKENEVYENKINQWKNEIVNPYIESLPKTKKEVVYIKIDPELSHEVNGSRYYTYSNEVQRTPLTVSYKDKGIVTVTDWYKASMELTDEEIPYVEYRHLNRDLGHGVDSGNYNLTVHLPESYKFTDIK